VKKWVSSQKELTHFFWIVWIVLGWGAFIDDLSAPMRQPAN